MAKLLIEHKADPFTDEDYVRIFFGELLLDVLTLCMHTYLHVHTYSIFSLNLLPYTMLAETVI